jgi:hypothetical protein
MCYDESGLMDSEVSRDQYYCWKRMTVLDGTSMLMDMIDMINICKLQSFVRHSSRHYTINNAKDVTRFTFAFVMLPRSPCSNQAISTSL